MGVEAVVTQDGEIDMGDLPTPLRGWGRQRGKAGGIIGNGEADGNTSTHRVLLQCKCQYRSGQTLSKSVKPEAGTI